MPNGDVRLELQPQGEPKRPTIIAIASWVWIIYGCLYALCFVLAVATAVYLPGLGAFWMLWAIAFAVFGAAFLYAGLQTLKGRARGTLGYSIGSTIVSILQLGVFFFYARSQSSGLELLDDAPPLVAGALAWLGRRQYLAWREARNANQPAENES